MLGLFLVFWAGRMRPDPSLAGTFAMLHYTRPLDARCALKYKEDTLAGLLSIVQNLQDRFNESRILQGTEPGTVCSFDVKEHLCLGRTRKSGVMSTKRRGRTNAIVPCLSRRERSDATHLSCLVLVYFVTRFHLVERDEPVCDIYAPERRGENETALRVRSA